MHDYRLTFTHPTDEKRFRLSNNFIDTNWLIRYFASFGYRLTRVSTL